MFGSQHREPDGEAESDGEEEEEGGVQAAWAGAAMSGAKEGKKSVWQSHSLYHRA